MLVPVDVAVEACALLPMQAERAAVLNVLFRG